MKPQGGTELMLDALIKRLDPKLLEQVNIVSRPEDIDETKKQVLWVHDMPADMPFIATAAGRSRFDGIVFVSSWQQQIFNLSAGVPFTGSTVIKNAIEPIKRIPKPDDGVVRLMYHPTPHRGLQILVPVFVELCKKYDNLHLDVFSNFDIYARPEMNKQFEELYEVCRAHEKISYHGTQPNSLIRTALQQAHIFSYPSIWRETSCLCAMEAMSADCVTVAPNYGALAETLANFSVTYDFSENLQTHARSFSDALEQAILNINTDETRSLLDFQKSYADTFYSWESRIEQWNSYLTSIIKAPKKKIGGLTWNQR
jgi:glycosyltransferase involved in cell wall biosynthesis